MNVRCAARARDVTGAFQYLFQNHRYTDFTLISRQDQGERYQVHKLIVSLFSPVLSKIVRNCDSYEVDTFGSTALQNMVNFFYNLNPVIENIHDVTSTKTIADKFEVVELANICQQKFSELRVTVDNALEILEKSSEFRDEAKERECIRLLGENKDRVLASQSFTKLHYEKAMNILEKIKDINMITEANFLHYAIKCLNTNEIVDVDKRNYLLSKVDLSNIFLNDFLDLIVSFPTFFSNVEISNAVNAIRPKHVIEVKSEITNNADQPKKCTTNAGTNVTNLKQFTEVATITETNVKDFKHVGTSVERNLTINVAVNTEVQENLPAVQDKKSEKQKKLTIEIMNEDDAVNVHNHKKRVKFTIEDEFSVRSLQVAFDDDLKKGLLGTEVVQKKRFHQEVNVNVSYEGIYNLMRMLKDDDDLTSRELIEVLNAAVYLKLEDLSNRCITKISKTVDPDPLFLDGLRNFTYFENQCLAILIEDPSNVILHPNFIHCSAGLILLLLQQSELKIKDESQLLLIVISWLESSKEDRKTFRSILLKNLAFENISTRDFKYAVSCYPNFFDKKEVETILAYRNAVGVDVERFYNKLPSWYKFQSRKYV